MTERIAGDDHVPQEVDDLRAPKRQRSVSAAATTTATAAAAASAAATEGVRRSPAPPDVDNGTDPAAAAGRGGRDIPRPIGGVRRRQAARDLDVPA